MSIFPDFKSNSEEESQWIEQYNKISDSTSAQIRLLSKEQRLPFLRAAEPSDTSLVNLYIRAFKKEDYETCEVAKALLKERGINNIPS
jgi:primosomal protein N''